jgi:ATP-dependent Clp protease protease subunit
MQEIIQRTSSGINVISLETENFDKRIINIRGEITQASAFEFALSLQHLNSVSETEPITVLVNSPGGGIDAGLLMYDAVQTSPAPVRLVVLGAAYSMAALVFAGGQHGRYMLPNSKLMLHEPLLGCPIEGNTSSIKTISDDLLATRDKINTILAKHTGKSKTAIEEVTKHDHYFTAEESVKFGMADKVITFGELVKEVI